MYDKARIENFSGGLNTAAGEGKVPEGDFVGLLNVFTDSGNIRSVPGPTALVTTDLPVRGFTRFKNPTTRALVYAKGDGVGLQSVFAYDEDADTHTDLGATLSSHAYPTFLRYENRLYVSDSNSSMQVWSGTGSMKPAGIYPPGVAATVADNGVGVLNNSLSGVPYRWYYTYFNDRGLESNPSPVSNELAVLVNRKVMLSLPVATPPVGEVITHYGIYREGGDRSEPYRVEKVAYPGTPFTYEDNISDSNLSLTQLEYTHNPPPGGFSVMTLHGGRVFGAGRVELLIGNPSRLWYSDRDNPEYFPLTDGGEGAAGGYLDVDSVYDDGIVALSSTGSLLVIGRKNSIFVLYGNRFENFKLAKQANVGVAGARAMRRCGNQVLFLARDKMVYMIGDVDLIPIGEKIENRLKAIPDDLIEKACTAYHDRRFYLIVPTGGVPHAFCYDFRNKAWTDLSSIEWSATDIQSLPPDDGVGDDELLTAVPSGYTMGGAGFTGIARMLDPISTFTMPVSVITPFLNANLSDFRKRLQSLRLTGQITANLPADPVIVRLRAKNANGTVMHPYLISQSGKTLVDRRVHNNLYGESFQAEVSGRCLSLEIEELQIGYQVIGVPAR